MPPRLSHPASRQTFNLLEGLVAATMCGVVIVAALSGVVALRKPGPATEEYATARAEQMRLLDFLAQDLHRATTPPEMDTDAQGIEIAVPDEYRFDASDPQHRFPIANDHPVNADGTAAVQTIIYRYAAGSITRIDPWQPLVASSARDGTYVPSGPVTLASNMDAFPALDADSGNVKGAPLCYNVTFHSVYQPLAPTDQPNVITLHNVTFVCSKEPSP